MGAKNGYRSNGCRLLLALALYGLSLTASAGIGIDRAKGQAIWDSAVNGKTTKIGSGGAISIYTPYKAPSINANGGGNVTGSGNVPVNGKNVPADLSGAVSKGDLANAAASAIGCLGSGPVVALGCAAAAVAIPLASGWFNNAGGRFNPDTHAPELAAQPEQYCYSGPCYWYTYTFTSVNYRTVQAACEAYAAWSNGNDKSQVTTASASSSGSSNCFEGSIRISDGRVIREPADRSVGVTRRAERPADSPTWYPATPQAIKDALYKKMPPLGIVQEMDNAGQGGKMPIGNITLSGPSSIPGPSTISITNNTTNTTTTTTTTTTNNYTYNGDTVTNTSTDKKTVTTTATKNPDGSTTTTPPVTTTETVSHGEDTPAEPPEQKVQCDKYPNSLGCAELDTPEEDIPKRTETITFQAEDVFGGGQCPADVMTTLNTLGGRSVKVVDWHTFCGMALPLRGLVIALASIMAFFIIMPGGVRE